MMVKIQYSTVTQVWTKIDSSEKQYNNLNCISVILANAKGNSDFQLFRGAEEKNTWVVMWHFMHLPLSLVVAWWAPQQIATC